MSKIAPFINLQGYTVTELSEREHDYQLQAEVSQPPTNCQKCNHSMIVGFGRRKEKMIDIPCNGKRTSIIVNRRRYRCKSCLKTFLENLPQKHRKRQMTNRLMQYIARESLRRTFTSIANEVGVDEKTVRNIYRDYCASLTTSSKF